MSDTRREPYADHHDRRSPSGNRAGDSRRAPYYATRARYDRSNYGTASGNANTRRPIYDEDLPEQVLGNVDTLVFEDAPSEKKPSLFSRAAKGNSGRLGRNSGRLQESEAAESFDDEVLEADEMEAGADDYGDSHAAARWESLKARFARGPRSGEIERERHAPYRDTFYEDLLIDDATPLGIVPDLSDSDDSDESADEGASAGRGAYADGIEVEESLYATTLDTGDTIDAGDADEPDVPVAVDAESAAEPDSEDAGRAGDILEGELDAEAIERGVEAYSRSNYGSNTHYADDSYAIESGSSDRTRERYRSEGLDADDDIPDAHFRYSRDSYRSGQPSARKPRRTFAMVAAIVAIILLVGAGSAWAYVSGISDNMHEGVDDDLRAALVPTDMDKEPFYMLLLGTDGSAERDEVGELDGVYRSDSMMLARIDPVEKKATLVSIGRDVEVDIPGYGKQKINAAYGFGGPALAVKTVSELAGVDISHYAQVDFDGFSELVNALGGIEVDVPIDIDDPDACGSLSAGPQTLNGWQSLILCRSRNAYLYTAAHPDEMRAANQRLVLSAIAHKLLDSDVATIANSVRAMSQYVTTDLDLNDIIGLAQVMKGLDSESDIYTASAPTTSSYVDDVWYENIVWDDWEAMMRRVDSGLPPTNATEIDPVTGTVIATAGKEDSDGSSQKKYDAIVVKNSTDIQGLAGSFRTRLMDAGYVDVVLANVTPGYSYPYTLVVYEDPSKAALAEDVLGILGQGRTFENDDSYLLSDCDILVIIGDDWVA